MHDYRALEREYVTGTMSLRALARTHGIRNHSSIMDQARRGDWQHRRAEHRARSDQRAVTALANDEGHRIAKEARVKDDALDAISETITRLRADRQRTRTVTLPDGTTVEEPAVTVTPRDLALMIDRVQILFGRPSIEAFTAGSVVLGRANPRPPGG